MNPCGVVQRAQFVKKRFGKYKKSLKYRLGIWPERLSAKINDHEWVWLHAVSVGEVAAVAPLVKTFKERHPQFKLLVSTVTETGNQLAHQCLQGVDEIIYFPLDLMAINRRVISRVNPVLFIMAETEIWPNFLRCLAQKAIPG